MKQTEADLVRSILAAAYAHAEVQLARAQRAIARGGSAGPRGAVEALAADVGHLATEGDAAVARVRKRLIEGGHHHTWRGLEKVAFGPFGMKGAPDVFFRNDGGTFVDATTEAGTEDRALGFGFAVRAADADADGDLDLLVTNLDEPPSLLRNETPGGSWLTVVCEDPHGGIAPIGTRVAVRAGGRTSGATSRPAIRS